MYYTGRHHTWIWKHLFDPEQIANIFGLVHMSDKYWITYDNKIEDAFYIHTNDSAIKFKQIADGLYGYKPLAIF